MRSEEMDGPKVNLDNIVALNIGAGLTRIPGMTGIDISDKADITLDLGVEKLPFQDNSVDLIFSYHTLEHVGDYLFSIQEIHRVLRHGGQLLLGLPHVSLTRYHLVNPYHRHNFNEHHFDLFDPTKLKGSAAEQDQILFQQVFTRLHYMGIFNLMPPPLRGWSLVHLMNVVRKFDIGLRAIKPETSGSLAPATSADRRQMLQTFDHCLASRVPYGDVVERVTQQSTPLQARAKKVYRWWHGH